MRSPTLLVSSLLFAFWLFAESAPIELPGNGTYSDRECGGTIENLWLDIVFVVDNSMGMTNDGLIDVAANMVAVLAGATLGVSATNPRTTRVGIVTYNKEATVAAGLDAYTSYDDFQNAIFDILGTVSNVDETYLSTGLAAAEDVLQKGSRNDRTLFKKVVVVYASAYNEDGSHFPIPVAERLKADEVAIITVAYGQNNEGALLQKLSKIASGNMNFDNKNAALPAEIQNAFFQINCFCPNGWTQYQQSYSDINSKKYGICLKTNELPTTWIGAKMACSAQRKNGYLVNEYTQNKHDFVLSSVMNSSVFSPPYQYHIGLSYYNNNWYWEQPFSSGGLVLTMDQFTLWNPGFPVSDSTKLVVMNSVTPGSKTGWQNIDRGQTHFYVCETVSCDTDNYCDSI